MISSTNSELLENTAVVVNTLSKLIQQAHGVLWPDTYSIFDIETTGFNREKDIIIEWGCCDVINGEITNRQNIVLNWLSADHLVPVDWTENALVKVAARMSEKGKRCRIDADVMREEGVSPEEALPEIYDWCKNRVDNQTILVTHNGWNFDYPMIASHFRDFMEEEFTIDPNGMIDTGMIEKASQLIDTDNAKAATVQTIEDYCRYIGGIWAKGVFWSLDQHCVPKYNLDKKYGASVSECHNAGYDSWLVHLLMQEYSQLFNSFDTDEAKHGNNSDNAVSPPLKRRRGQKPN